MPNLRVLYLTGNPVVKKIPAYRKNLTVKCKKLTYLDERPVFPKDRAAAEAWNEGGLEAEKACRQRWAEEERAKIDASVKGLLALRNQVREAKAKEEELLKLESYFKEEGDEEEEEEEEEDEEKEEIGMTFNNPESSEESLNAGDSGERSQNGIIFPWDLDHDNKPKNRNELGEGGRSLIVELPDTIATETKCTKNVKRPNGDKLIKNKLHEALLSAEWLQEKSYEKTETVNDGLATNADENDKNEETEYTNKVIKTANATNFEEAIEIGDNEEPTVIKNELKNNNNELNYKKYIKKVEEEILPNIAHFKFGEQVEQEKLLGNEIEEWLKIENEEKKNFKDLEGVEKEKVRVRLIEEIENKGPLMEVQKKWKLEEPKKEGKDFLKNENEIKLAKKIVESEVDEIICKAVNFVLFDKEKLIDEIEAHKILDDGLRVMAQLDDIGKFPLNTDAERKRSVSERARESALDERNVKELTSTATTQPSSSFNELQLQSDNSKECSLNSPEMKEEQSCGKNISTSIELQIVMDASLEDNKND